MKKIFLILCAIFVVDCIYSQGFDGELKEAVNKFTKKISQIGKTSPVIAFVEFNDNYNNYSTKLGAFLADEISIEASNNSDNIVKYTVIDRSNLDLILKEKNILKSFDRSKLAKDLGKINAADILVSAEINSMDGYFRVLFRLLDTKSGLQLGGFNQNFVKSPSLIEFQNQKLISVENTNNITPINKTTEKQILTNSIEIQESNQNQEIKNKNIGDACFKIPNGNYNAVVNIYKRSSNEILKTIDVIAIKSESCIYELPVGYYKMEVNWYRNYNSKSSINRTDVKEIKIIGGEMDPFVLYYE